jgi:hypothetical protein
MEKGWCVAQECVFSDVSELEPKRTLIRLTGINWDQNEQKSGYVARRVFGVHMST